MQDKQVSTTCSNELGTFAGVFTPSFLTIRLGRGKIKGTNDKEYRPCQISSFLRPKAATT